MREKCATPTCKLPRNRLTPFCHSCMVMGQPLSVQVIEVLSTEKGKERRVTVPLYGRRFS